MAVVTLPRQRGLPVRAVSVAVVVVALGYLITTGLSSATVYYVTVGEFLAGSGDAGAPHKPVRVSGNVVPGSIERQGGVVRFVMADPSGSLPVEYRGVVPDIFGDDVQVVVEGRPDGVGGFQAKTLLAKCPSKFEASAGQDIHV